MKRNQFARNLSVFALFAIVSQPFAQGQSFDQYSSTDQHVWQTSVVKSEKKASGAVQLEVPGAVVGTPFHHWGTCFNELGWDALQQLSPQQQALVLAQLFAPAGDLHFSIGRIPMNANDYARDWYSCDEVSGDFQLTYFNIERDKQALIPFIKAAQQYNPGMTFWISPWSPPSWMKINHYYSVKSDAHFNQMPSKSDIALYEGKQQKDKDVFPQQLTVNDYFIQDPRYLKTYADYFCKFISAYREIGIEITKAMFQNEPYSYTPYPGCAWTAEGMIRFNTEYLAPALKAVHPKVDIYLGTINSNRFDDLDKVLSDPRMPQTIKGVTFQWEGGQILPAIRKKYPQYHYLQSESECGWGSFDWKAAEHTFDLMNHYLGNGVEEYTFWNCILSDEGVSSWGWKQNALIRVDSKKSTVTYTPEYYAVKHFTHFIGEGSNVLVSKPSGSDKIPVMVVLNGEKRYVILAGNFNDVAKQVTVKIQQRFLNLNLAPHSLQTLVSR
jgi:glucosylceramidase